MFLKNPRPSPVPTSTDLERILALPRRALPTPARDAALVDAMNVLLRRGRRPKEGPCACRPACLTSLLVAQARVLWELHLGSLYPDPTKRRGVVGLVPCGEGKTGLDLLAPLVAGARRTALLVPSGLVNQLVLAHAAWGAHFRTPRLVLPDGSVIPSSSGDDSCVVRVVPYHALSNDTALLLRADFDLVVADEAHRLRHVEASRTMRFVNLFVERPLTILCDWSGTLIGDSMLDAWHLFALALGEASPLPIDPGEAERWALAVDPVPRGAYAAPEGELRRLRLAMGEPTARAALRARVLSSPGVVAIEGGAPCPAPLRVSARAIAPPPDLLAAIREVRRTWARPDGEELIEALEYEKCLRELAAGFFYRMTYPRGEAPEVIRVWKERRKAWRSEAREVASRGMPGLDSLDLVAEAARRSRDGDVTLGDRFAPSRRSYAWEAWEEVAGEVRPETEAVWVSPFLAEDVARFAEENARRPPVIFAQHGALLDAAAAILGDHAVAIRSGSDVPAELARARRLGPRPLLLSIQAAGEGVDGLQEFYDHALAASSPASGDAWEQLLGRLWRRGQRADEVRYRVYRHTPEIRRAFDRAVAGARFTRETFGSRRALLLADIDFAVQGE